MAIKNKKKKPPKVEARALRGYAVPDIRADEEGQNIEGHPAVYDQETVIGGYFREIIERGAFDNTDFTDVVLSANHEMRKIPLARSRRNNANSTMQLSVSDKGLYMRANLDTENNSEAQKLMSAIVRGDLDDMSFIFYVKDEEWVDLDTELPLRRIKTISKVIEVSAVNWGAYSGTDINTRDAADTLENAKKALDSAKSEGDAGESRSNELELLKLKAQAMVKG